MRTQPFMYTLKGKTDDELEDMIDLIKGHSDLTIHEKTINLQRINERLKNSITGRGNQKLMTTAKQAELLKDIEDGRADISDIGFN